MEKMTLDGLPAPIMEYVKGIEIRLFELEVKLENSQAQVGRLTEMLLLAQKARFGQSGEKSRYILEDGYEQETLFNEAEVFAVDEDSSDTPQSVVVEKHLRKPKRTKEELAKDLPVEEVVIDLPEEERVCGICECGLHPIGREFVRSELSVVPAQVYVTETYRVNYSCARCMEESDEANIVKPDVPVPVVKRGLASPSSAAYAMYQKYANSVPLYRQEKDWANFGVTLSRSTLANWIIYTSTNWLQPLWLELKSLLLESPIIMADETVVQILKEPGKSPQSESRMWVYCTGNVARPPPIVLYEYQPSRSGEHPKEFLKINHAFYLHTDAYAGYNTVENAVHCGCFAHLRRRFNEAMPKKADESTPARIGFEYCQKLFALERKFEELSPEERLEKRLELSKPVLDDFYAWIVTVNPLAGSKLYHAIAYAVNQREPLSAFLLDGRIEISTNRIENHIRPFTIGRKNWLFADTVAGAKASAVAYSIIQSAKANGLNPYRYLLHLFTELPTVLTKDPDADLTRFFPWSNEVQETCRYGQDAKGQLSLVD
ncbi:MAG: IS66 family transposase [Oscillospiraceae bacterium]|nr:IS66 family transposase [Oscillospiraceae bacterium]